jgi:hypothetical protein
MPHRTLFLLLLLGCTGCATLFNGPTTRVQLHVSAPATIVVRGDTIGRRTQQVELFVTRSEAPLPIEVFHHSLHRSLSLPARRAVWFWWNLYFNCGLGMLVDARNVKSYRYPSPVYINLADTIPRPFDPKPERRLMILVAIPFGNTFAFQPPGEPAMEINSGFWGLNSGVEYRYAERKAVRLLLGTAIDLVLPLPAPIFREGEYTDVISASAALTHQHRVGSFSLGYGLGYNLHRWSRRYGRIDVIPPSRPPVTRQYGTLGLALDVQYITTRQWTWGVVYRPSVLRFTTQRPWAYEHVVSAGFGLRI